jgi:hypothetical protein
MEANFERWLSWAVVVLCGLLLAVGVMAGALTRY